MPKQQRCLGRDAAGGVTRRTWWDKEVLKESGSGEVRRISRVSTAPRMIPSKPTSASRRQRRTPSRAVTCLAGDKPGRYRMNARAGPLTPCVSVARTSAGQALPADPAHMSPRTACRCLGQGSCPMTGSNSEPRSFRLFLAAWRLPAHRSHTVHAFTRWPWPPVIKGSRCFPTLPP